ncbi:AAA family ATPase [Microbacterium sp. AZCO]|uniref:AAA family ATPase n=1 Tax=Microbacterium sp. AZCO TaxID=3142976 RepID=UPI0031F38278
MRLVRVQITGYGRLRHSTFSTERKLTAILGPNEAGKSTILHALLALNDDLPIPSAVRNRSTVVADEDVVLEAEYLLDDADTERFADRPWTRRPGRMLLRKRAGGAREFEFDVLPTYKPEVWTTVKGALNTFNSIVSDALAVSDQLPEEDNQRRVEISDQYERLEAEVAAKTLTITPDDLSALRAQIAEQLRSTLASPDLFDPVVLATQLVAAEPDPAALMAEHLQERRPRFELFDDHDRRLEAEYLLQDLDSSVPKALQNLLSLAGTTLVDILPDSSRRTAVATAQDEATDTLEHVFENAWTQHPIAVKLGFEPDRITILVRDRGPGGKTISFDERSDGLRTFVALTAFLATRGGAVPPILLLDEAETRLHWDAQADLISVLQTSSEVGQIIYTTHSPGCLPPDLGTGVIFVQPDVADSNTSQVRRDFWTVEAASAFGASPILFLMGASAAAFSRVRRAIVAEGPSDMILLPTLFRAATKLEELDFQIVPGISTTSKERLGGLDDYGVQVAYLVDGDLQGAEWTKQLVAAGVDKDRIKSLPAGMAAEDLLDREYYIQIFLGLAGRPETTADLALGPGPLKPQLEELCANKWGIAYPSAVDVAERILGDLDARSAGEPDHRRVRLAKGAGPALRALHEEFVRLLDGSPSAGR